MRARAQMPSDDDTWKARCLALSANADAIDKGSAPQEMLQTTHGLPAEKFAAVARERAGANQHYIACTLYYTASMADHMGNAGKIDASRAHTEAVLAGAELKRATGQSLSLKEKVDRTSGKLPSMKKGEPLTPTDVATVFGAFSDSPAPAPPVTAASPAPATAPASNGFNPAATSASSKPKNKPWTLP